MSSTCFFFPFPLGLKTEVTLWYSDNYNTSGKTKEWHEIYLTLSKNIQMQLFLPTSFTYLWKSHLSFKVVFKCNPFPKGSSGSSSRFFGQPWPSVASLRPPTLRFRKQLCAVGSPATVCSLRSHPHPHPCDHHTPLSVLSLSVNTHQLNIDGWIWIVFCFWFFSFRNFYSAVYTL